MGLWVPLQGKKASTPQSERSAMTWCSPRTVATYRGVRAGRPVGEAIGLGDTAVTIWSIAKWPVLLGLAAVVVAIQYYTTPNVQQPEFKWISLGAIVAIITWVIASALFGLYVSQFSNCTKTYGSLAGVIILLLWLWITNP